MLELLRKSWWTISMRGLLITVFGVLAIMDVQQQTSSTQAVYNAFSIFLKLGFMFAVSGALLVFVGLAFRRRLSNWFILVITAIPDLVLAIYIFANGQQATMYFAKIMGIWIVIVGLVFAVAAVRVKSVRILLGIIALICLVFGTFVLLNKETTVFIAYGTISYFTVLLGLAIIALGFSARRLGGGRPKNKETLPQGGANDR